MLTECNFDRQAAGVASLGKGGRGWNECTLATTDVDLAERIGSPKGLRGNVCGAAARHCAMYFRRGGGGGTTHKIPMWYNTVLIPPIMGCRSNWLSQDPGPHEHAKFNTTEGNNKTNK